MIEESACELGGHRVRYRVAGSGRPALLVHGLAGSWRWWRPVVPLLARSLRLHLVDLPGFGSARGRAFVLADAPAFVRALGRTLELERPLLVGHSLGAVVCARVAAQWPDAVHGLVLAAPAALLERRRPHQYALPLARALATTTPRFAPTLVADALLAGAPTLYRAGIELIGDDSLRRELAEITAPTLLVWGSRDPLVPPDVAATYLQALPDARLVTVPGAGHVPMVDRPRAFAAAVEDFAAAL